MPSSVDRTIDAIWRMESPKIVAALARILGDVGDAEECAQDAFVSALTQWPDSGIPRSPGAWLMTAAKRRAIDLYRREKNFERKSEALAADISLRPQGQDFAAAEHEIDDDLLRLMFIACHPVLSREARVALTLKLVGGLTTMEISRAFLVPEPTIAQRIVRAKRTLSQEGISFELPAAAERARRVEAVLEVIYLVFNEGYAATSGEDVLRLDLVEEALRLGRVLAGLIPYDAEVHGLVSLMELQASRMRARVGPGGEPVLLLDQDRGKWNRLLIGRGLKALQRAEELSGGELGTYALQAALAACHARARTAAETDWKRIVALYDLLALRMPSPIVALNRAVAVGMADGPAQALELVDALAEDPSLKAYRLLPSVRADLLFKLGRFVEAKEEFELAASMTENLQDKKLLLSRAAACATVEHADTAAAT